MHVDDVGDDRSEVGVPSLALDAKLRHAGLRAHAASQANQLHVAAVCEDVQLQCLTIAG